MTDKSVSLKVDQYKLCNLGNSLVVQWLGLELLLPGPGFSP